MDTSDDPFTGTPMLPDHPARLTHDLRNCLYVIQNGILLLQSPQVLAEKKAIILQMMAEEERKASRLVSRLTELVRGQSSSTPN